MSKPSTLESQGEPPPGARSIRSGIERTNVSMLPRLARAVTEIRSTLGTSEYLALLLVNLDRLKLVNDICGYAVGDAVLDIVAQHRLGRMAVRTLQLTGGEFACLLCVTDDSDAAANAAQEILEAIAEPIVTGPHIIHLTASIGMVVETKGNRSAEDLLRAASIALSHAKNAGGNGVRRFRWKMFTDLGDRSALEDDLRSGLMCGEVVPYYQPIITLDNDRPKGFEALARWHHPRQGLIGPDRFLPIANELGLDRELLFTTLRQICRDARDWPMHFTASVNLSSTQLCDPANATHILQILYASGFAPERLIVEITEDAVIDNLVSATQTIRSLRNVGVKVALDDFGTGYASLSRLCDLQFDQIKIDRSLIQSLDRAAGRKLVKAVIDLGRSMSMPVTAEGIETEDHARLLRALGCRYGQGFLFAAPAPADVARQIAHDTST